MDGHWHRRRRQPGPHRSPVRARRANLGRAVRRLPGRGRASVRSSRLSHENTCIGIYWLEGPAPERGGRNPGPGALPRRLAAGLARGNFRIAQAAGDAGGLGHAPGFRPRHRRRGAFSLSRGDGESGLRHGAGQGRGGHRHHRASRRDRGARRTYPVQHPGRDHPARGWQGDRRDRRGRDHHRQSCGHRQCGARGDGAADRRQRQRGL